MTKADVADVLRQAGLEVPDGELDEVHGGVEVLRRLAQRLADRTRGSGDGDAAPA